MQDSHPEIACGGESKLNVFLTQLGPALRAYNEALDKTNDKIYREQAVYPPLGQPQARAVMQYLFLDRLGAVQRAAAAAGKAGRLKRSEEHTSELQSLMRISSAVFCLKKKNRNNITTTTRQI